MFTEQFIEEVKELKEQLEVWEKKAEDLLTPENGNRSKMRQYEVAMARYDVLHAVRSIKNFLKNAGEGNG